VKFIFAQPTSFIDNYKIVWHTTSSDSWGSMPIGNGDIGANVWATPSGELILLLSKTDSWSGNGQLLKLGRVRIKLPSIKDFKQTLELIDGIIKIQTKDLNVNVWIDANYPAINVELNGKEKFNTSVEYESWRINDPNVTNVESGSAFRIVDEGLYWEKRESRIRTHPTLIAEPDSIFENQKNRIVFFHRNNHSIWPDNLRLQGLKIVSENDPLFYRTFGAIIQGKGLINKKRDQLISKSKSKSFVITITPLTSIAPKLQGWVNAVNDLSVNYSRIQLPAARSHHKLWWKNFWERSWINVKSDSVLNYGYALQRWMNACAGRGNSPIKFNGSIFNVDLVHPISNKVGLDADYRLWGGCYWWQNTRLIYWSMLASGDYDLIQPLFKMYMDALPIRKEATKKYYHHEGAFFPETMHFWGTYNGNNYGWNRDNKPDGLADNRYIRRYWQGGIEMVALMLQYYQQTNEKEFCNEKLLPFASEILMFFNQHWPLKDGKILFYPSQSLETWWDATNPLPEIAGLRFVLPVLIEISNNTEQKTLWEKMLLDLPEIPIGKEKEKQFLLPAEKFEDKNNLENPELYALFPYNLYGVGHSNYDLALETWKRRKIKGTGGWQQDAIQAAILGLSDEAHKMVGENFRNKANGFRFPTFWGPNFDWVPDQDNGAVAMIALQKMLVQSVGDSIYLLPAWPRNRDVSFKLQTFDNTSIECKYTNGKFERLAVMPESRKKNIVIPKK